MISLLPPDAKKELAAARANVLLLRYIVLAAAVIAFLCLEMAVVYVFLNQQKASSMTAIATNNKKSEELAPVKAEATAFNDNLKIAETILSKQVSYTAIIKQFSDTLPDGVVIQSLAIDPATIGKPISMPIKAKSRAAVFAFKDNFNSSPYFENVSIQSITDATAAGGTTSTSAYPVDATVNITFKTTLLTLGGTP